jgi:hypothetical protein
LYQSPFGLSRPSRRKTKLYAQLYPADIENGVAVFGALGMFFPAFAKGDTKTYLNTSP